MMPDANHTTWYRAHIAVDGNGMKRR